ncbi:hypothetical protein DVH05_023865 [Phytophthora capsici]|nr:hypothetical protein DVH05_023865 [Phytophthora capsici]
MCESACSPDDFAVVSPTTKVLQWKRDDYPVNSISRVQNIVLKVFGDKLHEQAESFSLRLLTVEAEESDPIGTGVIGNIGETVITIAGPNDGQSGTLQFDAECFPDCASTKYSVIAGGTAVVLIQRRRGSDGDCSVTVATQAGTALPGLDYEPLEQTIFWKEGDASDKQILVRTVSRPDPRLPTRRVTLVLKNNKGAQMNGVHSSTTYVDIASLTDVFLGDVNFAVRDPLESVLKPPELGLIALASRNTSSRLQLCPSVVATESGVLSVAIQRNFADFLVPVRVVVTTVAGTATPSVDYEALNTVVSWDNDDAEVKYVLVRILMPPTFDPRPRSFWLQLSDVTGAIVGDCNLLEVVLTGIASGPHVSSFELDMALGTLTLKMSASVQASTLDVSKLLLKSERELKEGPIFKFSPQQTTTSSLDGAIIVLNIGAGDLNALKRVVGLARSDSTTFLSVGDGLFQYILNNCQSSGILACSPDKTIATSALAVSKFTADSIAPTLVGFSLDLPRRLLKLHFSEAVDFATLKIEALSFSETAGGVDVYWLSSSTTRLFSPQPDPLSGATLRDLNRLPADYTFLTLQLGRSDITSLARFGTGKIGISRANTFLGIGSSFVKDFAGNPVLAVSSPAFRQVSAADCSTCPTGTYLISSCSDLKDRKCATCSVCPGNSYALEACKSTQDTLCYRKSACWLTFVRSPNFFWLYSVH